MQYFTIFQDKLHSVNIQDDQSWAFSETVQRSSKHFQNHLYGQPVLTFNERQIFSEELRLNIIKNLFYFFYLMVL